MMIQVTPAKANGPKSGIFDTKFMKDPFEFQIQKDVFGSQLELELLVLF
jgi:hypothetical protein